MRRRFKSKRKRKVNKLFIILIIYISFSITYNTLYNYYIKTLSTDKLIDKIINDSKNDIMESNVFEKYKKPEYLLKLTLNLDLSDPIINTQEVLKEKEDLTNIDVLIYNTHDTEKYNDERFNNYNILPDVKLASNMLEEKLNNLGITTYVEKTSIATVLKANNWTYSKSYLASHTIIEKNIKNNNYKLIIDLHRDSSNLNKTYLNFNNKDYARILFVIGTENPTYEDNLNITTKLNNILEQKIPGITRGILKKGGNGVNGIYNQNLSKNSILIELGGQYNKIEDLNNTLDILSESILILLEGDNH